MRTGRTHLWIFLFLPWLARVSFSFSPFSAVAGVYLLSRNVLSLRFGLLAAGHVCKIGTCVFVTECASLG